MGGDELFNLNGESWNDIVTLRNTGGYVKEGAVQNTAYWSENEAARVVEDDRVALALARPSLSNTLVFKAANAYRVKVGLIQIGTVDGFKATGETTVEWILSETSLNSALSLVSAAGLALTSLLSASLLF